MVELMSFHFCCYVLRWCPVLLKVQFLGLMARGIALNV